MMSIENQEQQIDNVDMNVNNVEVKNAQEVLQDPQKKQQAVDYLKANEGKFIALIDKIESKQTTILNKINSIPILSQLPAGEKAFLLKTLSSGELKGINFVRWLAKAYADETFGKDATREQQKYALKRAKNIHGLLEIHDLWDDAKKMNRLEKKQDRLERKWQ